MPESIDDSYGDTWAIVLAGGDGSRLRSLTTTLSGVAVPKQYCSMWGGASLLEDALIRAAAVAPLRRICTVVGAPHRRWWSISLEHQASDNVIVQPQNRGTGVGILLALLHVLERDPYANIVLLPADHYLQNEAVMAASIRQLADIAAADSDAIFLLGAEPQGADSEIGYIVPTDGVPTDGVPADGRSHRPSRVRRFVEKPTTTEAAALLAEGALANVFVVAGSVGALLGLYQKSHDGIVAAMDAVLTPKDQSLTRPKLAALYEHLPPIDFSRDILQEQTESLRVVSMPGCGWTDLGTPERVAHVVKTSPRRSMATAGRSAAPPLSLAMQWNAVV